MTTELVKQGDMGLSTPEAVTAFAEGLQKFVKDNKLTANIQGKEYCLCEAWQYAGSKLSIVPVVKNINNLSTADEIKYSAEVELKRIGSDEIVGRGYAICSNKEGSKRGFAEYAICSMAQTRAVGKSFRTVLGWVMKCSGFEATPAEEMDFKNGASIEDTIKRIKEAEQAYIKAFGSADEYYESLNGHMVNKPSEITDPVLAETILADLLKHFKSCKALFGKFAGNKKENK